MGPFRYILLVLSGWLSFVFAEDLLFPYMHGLNYSEYDQAIKLGLTAHVCKDEAEWYAMKTADFARYKAIVIPDCQCNTSLNTIKFLDDTKQVWSPAVTGNMVIIGTDPSFHHKWFKLPGADAMMNDSIRLVSTGENGTGMYMSLSCYYQSAATPVAIDALSEIGDFRVRGNLSHPCLNNAHLVAKSDVMTSLTDEIASNWNCSVHEAFSEFPNTGSRGFQALAIALNATGQGQRSFGDGTSGIPYIIARGATPAGCGNNITETEYNEECDDGPANGAPGNLCSSSCQCILGMITPGVCRSNTTSSSTSSTQSSTIFTNSSSVAPSTSLYTNSSATRGYTTITASPSNHSNTATTRRPTTGPATITVFPPWPPVTTKDSVVPEPPAKTVTVEPPIPPISSSGVGSKPSLPSSSVNSGPRTVTVQPPSMTKSAPGTVTVLPPIPSESGPKTITVQPPELSISRQPTDSSGSPGDVTVTASGLPFSQPPGLSNSPTKSSQVTSNAGNTTVTGSGLPETQSPPLQSNSEKSSRTLTDPADVTVTATGQPQTQLPASSLSATASNPIPSNGEITVTASGIPPTQSRKSSMSEPLSKITTSAGDVTVTAPGRPSSSQGVVTVTASGQPDSMMSRETTSTWQTWSSISFGNKTGSSSVQTELNPPQPTVIVTARPSENSRMSSGEKSYTSPTIVTITAPGNPSRESDNSQTKIPAPTTGSWLTRSQLSMGPSDTTARGGTASLGPSGDPVSITSSKKSTSSFKSSTTSYSQVTEPGVTVPAFPSRLGTSSEDKTGTTSYKSGRPSLTRGSTLKSSSPRSSSGIRSSDTATRQPVATRSSTIGTQQLSQNPSHAATSSDSHGTGTSHTTVGTTIATSARDPIGFSTSPSSMDGPSHIRSGTLTIEPSGRTMSRTLLTTDNLRTTSRVQPSKVSTSSSRRDSSLSTKRPAGTTTTSTKGGISLLPAISSSSSRPSTVTSSPTSPRAPGTIDPSGLPISHSFPGSAHTSTDRPLETEDPIQTSSAGKPRTFHTYSRKPYMPVTNSSIFGTITTTFSTAAGQHTTASSLSSTAGSSPNHCDTWVGVEIIHMIEITERCPEGSAVTETVTEIVATMTRSICETSATNLPCYPCVLGTPSSSHDRATVTVTSCSTLIEPTVTVTVQLCSTCTRTTYTGTVPGYTPGSPCHACSSYGQGPLSTAAIPPPLAISTTSSLPLATPIPLITQAIGSSRSPKAPAVTTSITPLPDQHPSPGLPGDKISSSTSGRETTVRNPGGSPDAGVAPPMTHSLPPAKETSSTGLPDNNIPYGYPTTAATPYLPPIVTAGTVRNTVAYAKVIGGLFGLHLMYHFAFVWL